jgi:hypothetical protein
VNAIKPPGASPPAPGITPAAGAAPTAPGAPLTAARGAAPTAHCTAQAAPADPTAVTLADLRAGRISPDVAVGRLTDAALARARLPEAHRPAVAARLREVLAHDPTVATLLRRMGASVPAAEE